MTALVNYCTEHSGRGFSGNVWSVAHPILLIMGIVKSGRLIPLNGVFNLGRILKKEEWYYNGNILLVYV